MKHFIKALILTGAMPILLWQSYAADESSLQGRKIAQIDISVKGRVAAEKKKRLTRQLRRILGRNHLLQKEPFALKHRRQAVREFRQLFPYFDVTFLIANAPNKHVRLSFIVRATQLDRIEIIGASKRNRKRVRSILKKLSIKTQKAIQRKTADSLRKKLLEVNKEGRLFFINAEVTLLRKQKKNILLITVRENLSRFYEGMIINQVDVVGVDNENNTPIVKANLKQIEKKRKAVIQENNISVVPLTADKAAVLNTGRRFGIVPGGRYRAEKISQTIKAVFRLNFFKSVLIDVDMVELKKKPASSAQTDLPKYGLNVTFLVQEKIKINKMTFSGNKKINPFELRDQIEYEENNYFDAVAIIEAKRQLVAYYQDRGFYFASVNEELVRNPKTKQNELIFHINEGKRLTIRNIIIKGCVHLKEDQIRGIMKTKAAFWFDDGYFREEDFQEDLKKIADYYKQNGFYKADVSHDPQEDIRIYYENPKRKDKLVMDITIHVQEGEKYYFGGYSFNGNKILSTEYIMSLLTLQKGKLFNYTTYQKNLQALQQAYGKRGYVFVKIKRTEKIDRNPVNQRHYIRCDFEIDEGELGTVETVRVKGLNKTKKFVVKRELRLKENQPFDIDKLRRSQQEIYNLGYFKEPPSVEFLPGTQKDHIELVLKMQEQNTGTFNIGLGWASLNGFFTFAQIQEKNFLGLGQHVTARVEYGTSKQHYEIGFREPWLFYGKPTSDPDSLEREPFSEIDRDNFFYTPTSFNSNIFYKQQEIKPWEADYGYKLEEIGLTLGFGKQIFLPDLVYSIRWFTKAYKYYSAFGNLPVNAAYKSGKGHFIKNSLRHSLVFDSRDNIFNPTEGSRLSLAGEFVGFGGYDQWNRYTFEGSVWFPVVKLPRWPVGLGFKVSSGVMLPSFWGEEIIQLDDYFVYGGMRTIRGWPENFQGGARSRLGANTELQVPILFPMFYWVTFFDVGCGWNDIQETSLNLHEYLFGFGTGVTLRLPIFPQPLKLYVGKGFSWDEQTQTYRFNDWSRPASSLSSFVTHFDVGGAF